MARLSRFGSVTALSGVGPPPPRSPASAFWAVALIAAWSLVLPSVTRAQPGHRAEDPKAEAQAKAHAQKAVAALNAGRYDEATAEFQAGYAIVPLPAFILNMGHAQRQAGNLTRARDFYQRYLREEPASPQRAEVEKAIAEIDAATAKTAGPPGRRPPPAAAPAADSEAPRPPVALPRSGEDTEVPAALKVTREPIRKQEEAAAGPAFYREWWFWGTTAGVIIAAAAAFFFVRSRGEDYTQSGTLGTLGR